jgi:hypothetical protein
MVARRATENLIEKVTEEVMREMDQVESDAENEKRNTEDKKALNSWLNEKVDFKAIYDGDTYKDDLLVTINGKNYQIQRGKKVSIPRFVYLAIDQAERQLAESADNLRGLVKKFENEVVTKF